MQSLPGSGRSLQGETGTHSGVLAWRSPWTAEPSGVGTKHRSIPGAGEGASQADAAGGALGDGRARAGSPADPRGARPCPGQEQSLGGFWQNDLSRQIPSTPENNGGGGVCGGLDHGAGTCDGESAAVRLWLLFKALKLARFPGVSGCRRESSTIRSLEKDGLCGLVEDKAAGGGGRLAAVGRDGEKGPQPRPGSSACLSPADRCDGLRGPGQGSSGCCCVQSL